MVSMRIEKFIGILNWGGRIELDRFSRTLVGKGREVLGSFLFRIENFYYFL